MGVQTYSDLITQAAQELNIVSRGEGVVDPSMQQFLLDRLTSMVDSWNIRPTVIPWYNQQTFSLVPSQQSYLIGPNAPDWNAPRPIRIEQDCAHILLTAYGGPPVRLPVKVVSVEQWASITIPSLPIPFPQYLYLDRSMVTGTNAANGQPYTASRISLWGIPTQVNQLELFYWQQLSVGNLNDNVNAAPGYFRAMFLNLALEIASSFGVIPAALTVQNARDALGDVKELNAPSTEAYPDVGMPTLAGGRYLTRAQFHSGIW